MADARGNVTPEVRGYTFDRFFLDLEAGELYEAERMVSLRPKSMQLLLLFVENPRRLFERQELIRRLWPNVFVSDEALSQHISQLRRALRPFRGLKTLPRRGYRLDADVSTAPRGTTNRPIEPNPLTDPVPLASFVGRQAELTALGPLVTASRIVTVLGFGGVGKTRLVVELTKNMASERSCGVWFCDLSEARDAHGFVGAVARSLGISLGKDDTIRQIGHAIAGRGRAVVVLDNVEQLAEVAASAVPQWATIAEHATFLLTSRAPLRIAGERTFGLDPLRVAEARALFVERAHAVSPGLEIDDALVDDITGRLDRIPLAIELAAARVRVLPPPQLRARLQDRMCLLKATQRGVPARQMTLRATLDWSWNLLTSDEQRALAQLSVFEGGIPLWAAERVFDEGSSALDRLQSLVEQSLVRMDEDGRFGLLTTIAEYASTKLDERRERADSEHRHASAYRAWAASAERDDSDLGDELDNLVTACRRAIGRSEPSTGIVLLVKVWRVLRRRGPVALAIELAEQLDAIPVSPAWRADLDETHGDALRLAGRPEAARALLESALAHRRQAGDRTGEARARHFLGIAMTVTGRLKEAREQLRRAVVGFTDVQDVPGQVESLRSLARLDEVAGRLDEARSRLDRALALARASEDRRLETIVLRNLGAIYLGRERQHEAEQFFEAALVLHEGDPDPIAAAGLLTNLGILRAEQGRNREATAFLERSLQRQREVGNRRIEGILLGNLGGICGRQNQWDDAIHFFHRALQLHREAGNRRHEGFDLANLGEAYLRKDRLEDARQSLLDAVAIHRAYRYPRMGGVALSHLGELFAQRDERDQAFACWDESETYLRDVEDRHGTLKLLATRATYEARWGFRPQAQARLDDAHAIAKAFQRRLPDLLERALHTAREALNDS